MLLGGYFITNAMYWLRKTPKRFVFLWEGRIFCLEIFFKNVFRIWRFQEMGYLILFRLYGGEKKKHNIWDHTVKYTHIGKQNSPASIFNFVRPYKCSLL